ncbi:MAG: L,D-transpeptidase family protein [Eubacteriales bacterium]|nr:L,D-transpeptidase family protein [Eubacteriales bacterium]
MKKLSSRFALFAFFLMLFICSGTVLAEGWTVEGEITRYYDASHNAYTGGPVKIDGKQYLFSSDGALIRDQVTRKNGKLYLSRPDGALVTGWKKIADTKLVYFGSKNGSLKTGLQKRKGAYYYFSPKNGQMLYRWVTTNSQQYYFHPKTGKAVTGWKKIDGERYYFDKNGVKQTGWLITGGKKYYLDPENDGARTYGKAKLFGITCDFGTKGYLTFTKKNMRVEVNRQKNVVTIYENNLPIKAMTCSTGLHNGTPVGTFIMQDKLSWWYLNGPSIGQYCSHFLPAYLFHSVPMYNSGKNPYNVSASDYNKLGQQASEGCVRLCVADARWMYYNVPIGSTVMISDNAATPLGKPVPRKMKAGTKGADPTDNFSNPGGYSVSIKK